MYGQSLDDILRSGERLYLDRFKGELEADHMDAYAVIDTEAEEYVVHENKLRAIELAKEKFGDKLFYTVQVGSLDKPSVNYRATQNVAWNF